MLIGLAGMIDKATNESKALIVAHFTYKADKEQAQKILDEVKGRNCFFGSVNEKVLTFIVDVSGSMETKFVHNGTTYTRFGLVKKHLTDTLKDQLQGYQKFNIILFASSTVQFRADNVEVNQNNIDLALSWVNGYKTGGGTDISGALTRAFQSALPLEAIYFLTDGVPSSGVTTFEGIRKFVADNISARKSKGLPQVKIHTILFQTGGTESSGDRSFAREFTYIISNTSGGTSKNFQ